MTSVPGREMIALQEVIAGRYSIERELGRGGMGVVFLARDVALDRLVAIKLLPPALALEPRHRERFLREARTAAGLSHPNIVPIHAVEEHGDLVFFVMGYVDGETLRQRVERTGPLSPRLTMKVLQEVAWALAYAHEHGVVHRDVKPDNIMIETASDRALVTDFGIAAVARSEPGPGSGEVIGTARYMSPEQALGEAVDGRSDLYSLGATFFYGLTGRAPFDGASVPAILARQVSEPAPGLAVVRPDVPARLAEIVDRCLAKRPADRPESGQDVVAAIGEARGRELRAPPLIRSFVRNAEITTMVLLATGFTGVSFSVGESGVTAVSVGPSILGTILLIQLVVVARRLLGEGYSFADIRAALLAEAHIQEEEAEVARRRRWLRRLEGLWHRLWAGRVGRWFFRIAGTGLRPPDRPALPTTEATELVLRRAAISAWESLSAAERAALDGAPDAIRLLADRAELLRERRETGRALQDTVTVLENLRLALMRLNLGEGSVQDLTHHLDQARRIGDRVDRLLAG